MEKRFQFKTNINCGGCVAAIKPHLDITAAILEWDVATNHKDKILTVKSTGIDEAQILDIIFKAGFKAEPLIV